MPSDATTNAIALVTANFGGLDAVKPLPAHPGIDALLFTDPATHQSIPPEIAATWDGITVPDYPRHDFEPRLRAKYFKLQIHRLEGFDRYQWLAWADASVRFHDLSFLTHFADRLTTLPSSQRLMFVPHPERNSVREEYEFVVREMMNGVEYLRERYMLENMEGQMAAYQSRGWDLDAKLWCGTVWMIENNACIRRCWEDWWDDNLRYSIMDQLSLPMWLHHHGIEPQALDVMLRENAYFSWVQHLPTRNSAIETHDDQSQVIEELRTATRVLESERAARVEAEEHLNALRHTKTFRYLAPFRRAHARLRAHSSDQRPEEAADIRRPTGDGSVE